MLSRGRLVTTIPTISSKASFTKTSEGNLKVLKLANTLDAKTLKLTHPFEHVTRVGKLNQAGVSLGYNAMPVRLDSKKGVNLNKMSFFVFDLETVVQGNGIAVKPYLLAYTYASYKSGEHTLMSRHAYIPLNDGNADMTNALLQMLMDIALLNEGGKAAYVYSHNGGKFDIKVILPSLMALLNNGTITKMEVVRDKNNNIYQLSFKIGEQKFIFRDSYKLITASVAMIAKQFLGMYDDECGKLPLNHDLLNPLILRGVRLKV
jgi:hypothetical protein